MLPRTLRKPCDRCDARSCRRRIAIRLCGPLRVERSAARSRCPAARAALPVAYLVLNRRRAVGARRAGRPAVARAAAGRARRGAERDALARSGARSAPDVLTGRPRARARAAGRRLGRRRGRRGRARARRGGVRRGRRGGRWSAAEACLADRRRRLSARRRRAVGRRSAGARSRSCACARSRRWRHGRARARRLAARRRRARGARARGGGAVPRERPLAADGARWPRAATSPRRCAPTTSCGCACATSSAPRPAPRRRRSTAGCWRGRGEPGARAGAAGAGRRRPARGAQARHRPRRQRRWPARTPRTCGHAASRAPRSRRSPASADGAGAGRIALGSASPVAHEDDAERAVMAALRISTSGSPRAPASPPARRSGLGPEGAVGPVSAAARPGERGPAGAVLADGPRCSATRRRSRSAPAAPSRGAHRRGTAPGAATPGRPPSRAAGAARAARRGARRAPPAAGHDPRAGRDRQEPAARRAARRARRHRRCRGRCLPYGEGIAYWALREVLWEAAGDPARRQRRRRRASSRARRGAARRDPERARWRQRWRRAPASPARRPLRERSPETVADEIALAWPRFLGGLAARAPAVMAVEDLHWAEAALLDMVEAIVARSDGPLLLVATARPELAEARPGWGSPRVSQVALEPLTRGARDLVAERCPAPIARSPSAWSPGRGQPVLRPGARAPPRHGGGAGRSRTPCAPCWPRASTRCPGREARAAGRRGRRPLVLAEALEPPGGEPGPDLAHARGARLRRHAAGLVAARPARAVVRARPHARGRLPLAAARRARPGARAVGACSKGWPATAARSSSSCSRITRGGGRAGRRGLAWPGGRPNGAARRGGARAGRGRRGRAPAPLVRAGAALRGARAGAGRHAGRAARRDGAAGPQLRRRGAGDEALESFEQAIALAGEAGDDEARSRLRALAPCWPCATWGRSSAPGRARAGDSRPRLARGGRSFEAGALPLWRSWGGEAARARAAGAR